MFSAWKSEADYRGWGADVTEKGRAEIFELVQKEAMEHRKILSIFVADVGPKIYQQSENDGADDRGILIIDSQNSICEAAEISPYLKSFQRVKETSPKVHLSFCGRNLRDNEYLQAICERIIDRAVDISMKERERVRDEIEREKHSRGRGIWRKIWKKEE